MNQPPDGLPRPLSLNNRIDRIPGPEINAGLWAANELAKLGGVFPRDLPADGGGSGSALQWVRVYDDLPGYTPSGLTVTPNTVRCLPMTPSNNVWTVQTSGDFLTAIPIGSAAVTLADSGCCSGTSAPAGLVINSPIASDNRVTNAEAASVSVTGFGVASDSTVTVEAWPLGSGPPTAATATASATVSEDGSWTATIDLSSIGTEYVKIAAQETSLGGTPLGRRFLALTRDEDATNQMPQPSPPAWTDDDGRTSQQPGFTLTTNVVPDATGPEYRLFVNGDPDGPETDDTLPFSSALSIGVSLSTTLTNGVWAVQWVQIGDPDNPSGRSTSGTSNPTYVTFDTNAGSDSPAERFFRLGLVSEIAGVVVLLDLDKCRYPLSPEEITKLDA